MKSKLRLISLFCGCGGSDVGALGGFSYLGKKYEKNNIEVVHASDINQRAVNTYNMNFKHQAICEDIRNIDFQIDSADIVLGGFPCQNFSTVNPTKTPDDKDSQLFWEMSRVVGQVRPKFFVAENVKGFARLKQGKYIKMAVEDFEMKGYTVKWEILNSSFFGIPQLRERAIIVGVRNDLDCHEAFQFPAQTHGDGLKKVVPLSKVLTDNDTVGENYYFSKRAVEGVKKAKGNMKRAVAQDVNGPCLTITSHLAKVSLNSRDPVLLVDSAKERYRRFSPAEAAGIQSFPEAFQFEGSQGDAYRQIGNAIPPVLMWHIMQEINKLS